MMMRRAALRAATRRFSDALPAASGGVGVSPAVRDQTQFEQLRAEAFARRSRPDMAALVKCGSLHEAVAEVVSAKMSRAASDTRLPRGALRQLLWDALRGDERVGADVAAIIKRDPAATTHLQTIAYLKGFHAVQAQRAAHVFWKAGGFENDHVAFAIQDRINELFAVCVHPGAQIGGGCFIDHATSVVIGETATIGRDCTILHGVTLGGTGKARTKRHPSIGDRVTLGVGATIVGDIRIGDDVTVAAQAVVSVDVPPGMTVVGTNNLLDPAKLAARVREAPDVWAFDPELHLVAPDSDAGAAAWHGGKGVGSKGGGRKETS